MYKTCFCHVVLKEPAVFVFVSHNMYKVLQVTENKIPVKNVHVGKGLLFKQNHTSWLGDICITYTRIVTNKCGKYAKCNNGEGCPTCTEPCIYAGISEEYDEYNK